MDLFQMWPALAGGALIGLASLLVLALDGRILGVSGVIGGLLDRPNEDTRWRLSMVAGLVAGGLLLSTLAPSTVDVTLATPTPLVILAGLCVGFGTRMGNGCTSGHGVCGIGRLSPRSLVATVTFIITGVITVAVTHSRGVR